MTIHNKERRGNITMLLGSMLHPRLMRLAVVVRGEKAVEESSEALVQVIYSSSAQQNADSSLASSPLRSSLQIKVMNTSCKVTRS